MFACVLMRRTLAALLGCALALVGGLLFLPATPVAAGTTYTVSLLSDTGAGAGTTGDLRFAITHISAGDTINITATGTILLSSALPALTNNVTITGPTSGAGVIIDGGCTFNGSGVCTGGGVGSVFTVNGGVTVSLSNVTIQHASAGGISNLGTLTVTNSTLTLNKAARGGGIFNGGAGTLSVTNSTVTGNSASNGGGGISNNPGGVVTVRNSTITGNSATGSGGGILIFSGGVTVTNTIVAGNTATSQGPDIQGTVTSGGHNLIGNTTNTTVSGGSGDILNVNAQLGTLSSNGGTTQTIPLSAGSPAIGAGDTSATGCASTGAAGVNKKDQRGFGRSALVCDIGAYETAKTYTVGSTSDGVGGVTLTTCQSAVNTTCRLRDAIGYAISGQDMIVFDSSGRGPISLGSTLTLAASVTITGPTSGTGVTVDGSSSVTVFTVNSGKTVSLSNLTIQHGGNPGSSGTLGGGIKNLGNLSVTNSTLTNNNAGSSSFGGGIFNESTGTLFVTNSTFSNNSAIFGGGIENNNGTVTVTNSTLSGNSAPNGLGGGIRSSGGTVTLTNTIAAGNTATSGFGPDLAGAFTSGGHNLIGDNTNSTGITDTSDILNANAQVGSLSSNGGTTQTIALLTESPAIDAGDATVCAAAPVSGTDQRGSGRSPAKCSIGAFEPQQAAYTVGSTSDTGPMALFATCQDGANTTCKLRDALAYAASGSDTITFNTNGRGPITLTRGTLTLEASMTVTGPTSGTGVIVDGGGNVTVFVVNSGKTVSLSNLTVQHGNAVSGGALGGGIINQGTLTLTNSTLTSNSANGNGGGIYNSGTLTVTNSTLSGNSASSGGGGIYNNGTLTAKNTILAGNTAPTDADITVGGGTIIRTMIGGDPLLAPLANNGGPTQTRLPLPGSPVIGDGTPAICNQTGVGNVNGLDQRGFARPTDLCALGAVEPVLSRISPAAGITTGGNTVTLTGSGFAAGTSVNIGGASCTNVLVANSTTLTCTVAAHAVGAVDVVVTEGNLTGTLTGGYTYGVPPPQPDSRSGGTTGTGTPPSVPGSRS